MTAHWPSAKRPMAGTRSDARKRIEDAAERAAARKSPSIVVGTTVEATRRYIDLPTEMPAHIRPIERKD